MRGCNRRWEGRRFYDPEMFLVYQRILEGRTYVEIAAELNCSLKFRYRQFGTQKERARRGLVRSPHRLSPAEREEVGRGLQAGLSFRGLAARLGRTPSTVARRVDARRRAPIIAPRALTSALYSALRGRQHREAGR